MSIKARRREDLPGVSADLAAKWLDVVQAWELLEHDLVATQKLMANPGEGSPLEIAMLSAAHNAAFLTQRLVAAIVAFGVARLEESA
jgi:hypothetical protein